LNACFKYSSDTISRIGSRRRPRALTPAPTTSLVGPNRSAPSTMPPLRSLCAKAGANAASISDHDILVPNTASGWRMSIIVSSRARKKSSVAISALSKTPRNRRLLNRILGIPAIGNHPSQPAFMRVCGVLQGRLDSWPDRVRRGLNVSFSRAILGSKCAELREPS
jgi:hypothetical protein